MGQIGGQSDYPDTARFSAITTRPISPVCPVSRGNFECFGHRVVKKQLAGGGYNYGDDGSFRNSGLIFAFV